MGLNVDRSAVKKTLTKRIWTDDNGRLATNQFVNEQGHTRSYRPSVARRIIQMIRYSHERYPRFAG